MSGILELFKDCAGNPGLAENTETGAGIGIPPGRGFHSLGLELLFDPIHIHILLFQFFD